MIFLVSHVPSLARERQEGESMVMDTQSYIEGSLRPYASRTEFDLQYPIAYQPELGIINTSNSQSISQSLPIIQAQHGGRTDILPKTKIGIHGLGKMIKAKDSRVDKSLNDLEWREFLDLNNVKSIFVGLSQRFIQNWLRCLISQPFDVIKILLQVGSFKIQNKKVLDLDDIGYQKPLNQSDEETDSSETSDNENEINGRDAYFVNDSTIKLRESKIQHRRKASNVKEGKGKPVNIVIEPESLSTFDMLSSLLAKEGPRGILKSVNTTFLLRTLHYTLESWISGLISGLLGIPDPIFVDMVHSPNINLTLFLKIFSNVLSSLLLTQLNLIRIKFIVTTSTKGCRSFREILSQLPRFHIFKIPRKLLVPAILTNFIKSFTLYYPEYLLISLKINKYNNPYFYNMSSVMMKIIGLFIRLPFETIFSRCQVNYLLTETAELPSILRVNTDELCIEFGGYYGYLSTIYYILVGSRPLNYEGQSLEVDVDINEENKGIKAIFRGWRIGLIKLVSSYTLNLLSYDKYDLHEERF